MIIKGYKHTKAFSFKYSYGEGLSFSSFRSTLDSIHIAFYKILEIGENVVLLTRIDYILINILGDFFYIRIHISVRLV